MAELQFLRTLRWTPNAVAVVLEPVVVPELDLSPLLFLPEGDAPQSRVNAVNEITGDT